jgi:biopolymer transport protein ExbD
MRANRSIRLRGMKKKKGTMDIDITSLLDILVIMLVFLLQSYNASGVILNVPKGVELPTSESITQSTSGVIIQVSATTVFVDDVQVYEWDDPRARQNRDQNGRRIIPLYNELVKKKEAIANLERTAAQAIPFSGIVNLLIDKTIRYNDVRAIMHTAALAGFQQYKFVVLGEEQL